VARVIVAGSINMDVVARVEHFPRPGETLLGDALALVPGGKGANQAVAARRCGASVQMVGRVGDDAFGRDLHRFLTDEEVDVSHVATNSKVPTGTALIVVNKHGENTVVVVVGANGDLRAVDLDGVRIDRGDVVVGQNEIGADVIGALFERARAAGATTVWNAAPALAGRDALLALANIVVVNESEAAALGSAPGSGHVLIVTLGARGVSVSGPQGELRLPGHAVTAVDTTGAGDCFVGALAARLANDTGLADAVRFANAAASVAVQRSGAGPAMPLLGEVEQVLA